MIENIKLAYFLTTIAATKDRVQTSRYVFFPSLRRGRKKAQSSNTYISKFEFDLNYCQALYHEPLARDIAQALPVLLTLNKLLYFSLLFLERAGAGGGGVQVPVR